MADNVITGSTESLATETTDKKIKKPATGKKRKKKIRKIIIWVIILAVIAVALLWHFGIIGKKQTALNVSDTYTTFTVMRRDVQNVLSGTGTLQPLDSYNVTALSSGEILEDYFEEGDSVAEDQLLMVIDSESLESSLERAESSYEDAKENLDSLKESRDDLNVVSDYSGTIQVLNIEVGDEIKAGSVIASIIDRDTMLIDIPFMQADSFGIHKGDIATLTVGDTLEELTGSVKKVSAKYDVNENGVKTVDVTIAVSNPGAITESTTATAKIGEYACTKAGTFYYNVNETINSEGSGKVISLNCSEGSYVSEGQVVAVLENEDLEDSITRAERSLKDALNNLEDARDSFDNYQIKAPISGTVVEKNYKKGEKIGSGSGGGGSAIAVIYDMSALKFDMNIDELDIDSLSIGQEVVITSDAKPGARYAGHISKMSVQGSTSNGTTYYPITVTVSDYGQNTENALRPGMNIDAEIILEKVENALVVPVEAIGRGNKVKVIKKSENSTDGNSDAEQQMPDRAQFPENGKLPEGVQLPEGTQRPEGAQSGKGSRPSYPNSENGTASGFGNSGNGFGGGGNRGGYSTAPKDTEYEERTVETGISDETYIQIISGLEEGDTVIVESSSSGSGYGYGMSGMGMGMGGARPSGMPVGMRG